MKIEKQIYDLDDQIAKKVEQAERTKTEIAILSTKLNNELIESDKMLTEFSKLKKSKELKEIRLKNKITYLEVLSKYKEEVKKLKYENTLTIKQIKAIKHSEKDSQDYLNLLKIRERRIKKTI
ncbi:hypothetical protein [Spiroplasma floricola]|uniref:Uncharacterized protein n=1 Tax=Spiroplasma floricola 23-6 TaxID=1336749 RepID=A0A2K8SF24_9MOLU|nr:hypothetical protein [Spiroplasma floricola]AUB32067.1 hypothetical protein SFLOR_v1c10210 [Spiroplasma floricola 23-6]